MKTNIKLSIIAAVLASLLALAASVTHAVSPQRADRALLSQGAYPFLIGASGDDHSNLLLSFAQGVAPRLHDPSGQEQPATLTAQSSSPPAQPTRLPVTGSTDTASIVTGLLGLALRLLIVGGLALFLRSRTRP